MEISSTLVRSFLFFFLLLSLACFQCAAAASVDYGQALSKAILYFEAQRSGKLPPDQRVLWRADSALKDGSDAKVDLAGGYYDSGDNVKFGFPMAFTLTTLSWSVVENQAKLQAKGELSNALAAVRWGTDYLLKASATQGVLYGEVGDGNSDHSCWQRPEDMTTPRTVYKIDQTRPGSDLAGETAAALAAASIAFRQSNSTYSALLLDRAKTLFDYARTYRGLYSNSISVASSFYPSSGYEDELLWAAAWLHRATGGDANYLSFLSGSSNTGGVRTMFFWDDKFFGAQVLASKLVLEGKVGNVGAWASYKTSAEEFLCNLVQKGRSNKRMSPGGMMWWDWWNNFQYTTSSLLALTSYSDYLSAAGKSLVCASGTVSPAQLISFASSQVDYMLGANPKKMSYMVGFGSSYPQKVHHRGASIPSIKTSPSPVDCGGGFGQWFHRNAPNPNVLVGAVVGGPDVNDAYTDSRANYQQAEPATVNTAPLVGVLARLA